MIALIQRVSRASVTVEDEVTGEIGPGLLVLLGVERDDDEQKANRLCERVLGYRIFSDAEGKMNLNVQQKMNTQTGRFAADMQVSLVNDGPVTFWLQV